MTNAKLVDVLVPCAGSARYLRAALQSVLAQTYPNIRIWVFDNGCPHDRCVEIVNSFGDNRLNCVKLPRLPAIFNWNRCLAYVGAPFFAFIHDDDLWPTDHIAKALDRFSEEPETNCVLSAHYSFASDIPADVSVGETGWWHFLSSLDKDDICFAMAASPISHMSAAIFRTSRLSFDTSLAWNADQAYVLSHALAGKCAVLAGGAVRIRQHAENDTRKFAKAYASVACLGLMRRSISQLNSVGRLRSDFVSRHLEKCPPGMIFRLLQCAYSWPPVPSLRTLGRTLTSDRQVIRRAALYSKIVRPLSLCPSVLWPLACLVMDLNYYSMLKRRQA